MKPKIALLGSLAEGLMAVNRDYLNAVLKAGGIPSLLPYTEDEEMIASFASEFDGFLFCGGVDIDPKYYGEEMSPEIENICSERDSFEEKMFNAVYKTGKPILGICRGEQVINVFRGGTLYQHIEGHRQGAPHSRTDCPQRISLSEWGMLSSLLEKKETMVNSFHHQCVKCLAPGLLPDAYAEDGYIEAFHDPAHRFLLCVQWHPEIPYTRNEDSQRIFAAFIDNCRAF